MTNKEREYLLALANVMDERAATLNYDTGMGGQLNYTFGVAHGYRDSAGMLRLLLETMEQDAALRANNANDMD